MTVTAVCSPLHEDPAARPDCGAVAHVPPTPTTPTAPSEPAFTEISNVVPGVELDEPEFELLPDEPLPELLFDEPEFELLFEEPPLL